MTNLSRCTGLSFLLLFICSIRCEDENYFENLADPDDLVNPHSFSYDKQSKSMVDNTLKSIESAFSKDYTKEQEDEKKDCKCVKNVDNSDGQVALFYKRLINMMLLNMHIKGDDVLLVGTLEIIMTPSELEILKNFGTQRSSIKEIDEILSAAMKMPNNRLEKITDFIAAVFERLGNVFRTVSNHPDVLLILGILFATLATLRMIRHGHARVILILAVVIFVQSFLMTWWRLIKEEEAKNMAEQMKFSNVPKSCQPDKMTLWDKFVTNLFGSNECEKYYEAMMSNPKLKVTPLYALTHLCSTVMLQPIVHIGTVISDFINNATDALPWQYGWLIRSLLYLAVCIVIIMLPLCLMGGSVDLGFGPLFKFAIGFHKRRGPGNSLESEIKREPVQIYLQVPGVNTGIPSNAPAVTNAANIMDASVADVPAIMSAPVMAKQPAVGQLIQFEESGDDVSKKIDDVGKKTDDVSKKTEDVSGKIDTKNVRDPVNIKKHDGGGDTLFDYK